MEITRNLTMAEAQENAYRLAQERARRRMDYEKDMETRDFECEIRANNCLFRNPCGFCGLWIRPEVPLALFEKGTIYPVCAECGSKYAPELVKTVEYVLGYINNMYHDNSQENDTGDEIPF